MNVKKFEYLIFPAIYKSKTIYELAKINPDSIFGVVLVKECENEYNIRFVSFRETKDYFIYLNDKKRLAKKVENVVKSYCNNFGYAYVKAISFRSAKKKIELLHKIEKTETELTELKKSYINK